MWGILLSKKDRSICGVVIESTMNSLTIRYFVSHEMIHRIAKYSNMNGVTVWASGDMYSAYRDWESWRR